MSDDDLKHELDRLRNENATLKAHAAKGITMKVSEKGGLSVYRMGRFPVTLYKEAVAHAVKHVGGHPGLYRRERRHVEVEGVTMRPRTPSATSD